jgi:hypothetical protein
MAKPLSTTKDNYNEQSRLRIYRIINHNPLPKVAMIFNELLMNRVRLISGLPFQVGEEHYFRYCPAVIYHLAFFGTGNYAYVQFFNMFNFTKRLYAGNQLVAIFLRIGVFMLFNLIGSG